MSNTNEAAEAVKNTKQLINLGEYQFPKGFIVQTKLRIWLDEAAKDKLSAEELAIQDALHELVVKFDMSDVNLAEFVHKVLVTSSSPRVSFQNQKRPLWRKIHETDEKLVEALAIENVFTVDVSEKLKLRTKQSPVDKAQKHLNAVTAKDDLLALQAQIAAKIAEMS